MTDMEFRSAITPLINKWPRGFSPEQLQLFHVEFKEYSMENFKKVATHILMNSKVAPMLDDFRRTINLLGIKRGDYVHQQRAASPVQSEENFEYQIRDNIFADNNYIFIRGNTVRTCSFILKADQPNHPLVIEDREIRSLRLQEIKNHLKNNTYQQYADKANAPIGFRQFRPLEIV